MPTARPAPPRPGVIEQDVRAALAEDLGRGDVSAQLISASRRAVAELVSREAAAFCGRLGRRDIPPARPGGHR